MHVPDGFLDAPTSVATGAVALAAIGLALRHSRREMGQDGPVLAGLTACFVFAAQMVNFPVGAGTSGHLIGGVLAAALVGPWTAILVMSSVLLVQALLFADGGLTALGTNITLMGVVAVVVGWAVMRSVLAVLPRRSASLVPAAALGAALSVPAAAAVFSGLFLLGGAAPVDGSALTAAMVGWHLVIGLGEAAITASVLAAVAATRPDLVHAGRLVTAPVQLVDAHGVPVAATSSAEAPAAARPAGNVAVVGLLVALVVGCGVSLLASSHPDGLEYVAGHLDFAGQAAGSLAARSPLADYSVRALGESAGSLALAGGVGVVLTLLVAWALSRLATRR